MNCFNRQAIALLLVTLQQDVAALIPSSSRGAKNSWGLTHLSSKEHSRLAVSVSSVPDPTEDQHFEFDELEEFDDADADDADDDDFDYEGLSAKKEEWDAELRRFAKSSAQDPNAVAKAQAIFDDMFEAYVMSEDSSFWPNVDVYNLLIETHAYSKFSNGAEEAELILSRMEDASVETIARPNMETYLNVIDAWAMRKNTEKAHSIVGRLEKRFADTEDEELQPTVEVYNKLIKAYGMVGDFKKVEAMFEKLLGEESEELRANKKTWVQVMKAFAAQAGGVDKVQELFRRMLKEFRNGNDEYRPTTAAYNVLIRALGQQRGGVVEAEAMLYELIDQYNGGDEEMCPNAETFRNVILAFKNKPGAGTASKAETLLQIQEGMYKASGNKDLKADARVYNSALSVIARSKDSKKATKAKRIVDKLEKSTDKAIAPTVWTYFTLLSACAHTEGEAEEKFAAFQIAVNTLKFMRESDDYLPDSGCYGMFLKACTNLMPSSRKRDGVVENIFRKCCSVGLLTDFVLKEFEGAASEELQLEVLGGFIADGVRVPEAWSSNTVERTFK
jgi:pentatricopeptide repeat protein